MSKTENTAIVLLEGGIPEVVRGDVAVFDIDHYDVVDQDTLETCEQQLAYAKEINAPERVIDQLTKLRDSVIEGLDSFS